MHLTSTDFWTDYFGLPKKSWGSVFFPARVYILGWVVLELPLLLKVTFFFEHYTLEVQQVLNTVQL